MTGDRPEAGGRRVVVVTGGGAGIGAAIATELGRRGDLVVTVDPLVTLDGADSLPRPEETTADRIVAAGGAARASSTSVTDGAAVKELFDQLVVEHGRLDAVVNVAGISRPTSFAGGTEADWREVVAVHLGGYLNVLRAALPIMAAAGHGRILGVTSGSGWREADTGAYGCAKRAVAALTWQLGRVAPPGVTINALSPIAVTRMVTEALARTSRTAGGAGSSGAAGSSRASSTGGLSLGSMPAPDQLGPIGAHLAGSDLPWLSGQVVFAAGDEAAVVEPPRLLEAVDVGRASSPARLLDAVTAGVLGPAEGHQASTGGSNPRLSEAFRGGAGAGADPPPSAAIRVVAVISDRPEVLASVAGALEAWGVRCAMVQTQSGGGVMGQHGARTTGGESFDAPARTLARLSERVERPDAVVVAVGGDGPSPVLPSEWEVVLAEHDRLVDQIHGDAAWARAVADAAAASGRPMRLVTLVDARTAGGRSRAQAATQLSRAARKATDDRVAAFAVAIEAPDLDAVPVGELAAHLACSPETPALSGAELVAGDGWFGLRSHPRPSGTVSFDGPDLPPWFEDVLRRVVEGDVGGARS